MIVDRDVAAGLREADRDGLTDSRARPRDQRGSAVEPH
jgi:hypothetical protein